MMVLLATMNVLSVGTASEVSGLDGLPIRLTQITTAEQAVRSFKTEQFDSVISQWHLADMPNGMFLRKLRAARPALPTIAIIQAGHRQQEIDARSLGVTAVICDNAGGDYLRNVIAEVLGLRQVEAIETSDTVRKA